MLDSDASTAKTLTLVAIIIQVIFFVIGIVAIAGLAIVASTSGVPLLGAAGAFGILFLVGLIWILLDYFLVYKPLAEERVEEAQTPSIVLGIIQLIIGGVITGILLIVAYVKIRDSMTRRAPPAAPSPQQPQS